MAAPLYHLALAEEWAEAQGVGEYRRSTLGLSLDDVGFIHCSYRHQVPVVADAFYRGHSDLVLLRIDPALVGVEIRVENVDGGTERFPHLYGPLRLGAVTHAAPVAGDVGRTLDAQRLHIRRWRHEEVSAALAELTDDDLAAALGESSAGGWGSSTTARLAGHPVFVKRVPLTDRELASSRSTRNHFGLPTFYNYGVGSAGFGVWRELIAHERTTEWVLSGTATNFPLLHHARVLRRSPGATRGWVGTPEYIEYWGGSEALDRFCRERVAATHEVCMVVEHHPHTMSTWIPDHQDLLQPVLSSLCATACDLWGRGVVHFDAHASNVVLDDEATPYLTDFGLWNATEFDLGDDERRFLQDHRHYDAAVICSDIAYLLTDLYDRLDDAERDALAADLGHPTETDIAATLVDRVDQLHETGRLPVSEHLVQVTHRWGDVALAMRSFFRGLAADRTKSVRYDDAAIVDLFDAAGGPP